jgi:LCP family protein required for cell wall assembly
VATDRRAPDHESIKTGASYSNCSDGADTVPVVNVRARHGRLPRRGAVKPVLAGIASFLGVVLASTSAVAGIAVWQLSEKLGPGVIIEQEGEAPPAVGPIDGPVNILLVGSDSGGGNANYGERGENLNDVTILLHISPVAHTAIAVSFPRDLYVPITGCESNPGTRKINEALYNGGLACAVSTVEALSGQNIGYAAQIEFDGVIEMSDAVGGVTVCVAEPIHDLQIHLDMEPGEHTIGGFTALQFLRSRHGVGDGSDTARIGNQQLFLSALMRKIKAEGTLTNPITVYALASAAANNMELSTSLNSLDTMASMALAVKDIPLKNIAFVSYPSGSGSMFGVGGRIPDYTSAKVLMDAIKADAQIVVTGDPAGGALPGEDIVETTPTPTATSTAPPTIAPEAPDVVELPSSITGQQATEKTCTDGNTF